MTPLPSDCLACNGDGWTMEPDPNSPNMAAPEPMQVQCPECYGTGEIEDNCYA